MEPATVMRLFATFDHRILDGAHAAKMASTLKRVFADPWTHFGGVEVHWDERYTRSAIVISSHGR